MKNATLENGQLLTLLRRVKIFAGKNEAPEAIRTVHLVERRGDLYAEATDRYRLLVRKYTQEKTEGPAADEGFEALLRVEDVDLLLSTLRALPKDGVTFISVDDAGVKVKSAGLEFDFIQQASDYPPIQRLLPDLSKLDDSGWTFVDLKRIKDLTPVGEKHPTLLMATVRSGGKPDGNPQLVFSTDPEVEIGMFMGIRTDEHNNPLNKLRSNWNWLPNHH